MLRLLAILALVATLAACREAPPEPYLRVGDPAPAALAMPAGRAQLVALWGSWCAPCVAEAPDLAKLAADPPEGVERVAILVVSEGTERASRTFPGVTLLPDPDGDLAGELRVDALPVAFLVRGDRLVARFEGARAWDARPARRTLSRLLASEPTSVDPAPAGG